MCKRLKNVYYRRLFSNHVLMKKSQYSMILETDFFQHTMVFIVCVGPEKVWDDRGCLGADWRQ